MADTADTADTADDDRLEALWADLMSDPDHVTGKRRPPPLAPEDAIALARGVQAQIDRGVAAREELATKQRMPIVCARGCNGCCEEPVLVYLPEAMSIAAWLMEPEHHAVRDAFLAAYPAWKKAAGDGPARLEDLQARDDHDAFFAEHRAQWRRRVMCAFNQGGDCAIYPVRPAVCRNAHAVETHERCSGANVDGRPARRLEFEPLDAYRRHVATLWRAAHHALGGERRRPRALPEAVHRLVQSAMAAARRRAKGS